MHGKRLQWVLLQNHQIRPFSRTQASFASFLKILVCRIDGHGAQSIQDRNALLRPQHRPLLCNAVHCAPYSLQHVRLDNGRILMERITEALCARRGRGADARRAFRSEILEMHVAPMVYMSHKKRRYHPVLCRPGQLVRRKHLRMDDNGTYCPARLTGRSASPEAFPIHAQILFAGGVTVAMHQQLHIFVQRSVHIPGQFFVAHTRITAIIFLCTAVRLPQPRGACLR